MIPWLYKRALKPLLFRFDPEQVHHAFVGLGSWAGRSRLGRTAVGLLYDYRGADVSRVVDGLRYRTPVLLAAGFDYNGHLVRVLPHLAFGGQEVGSVTAVPCAGNPPPRMRRLIRSRSLLVNKGLKNDGVEAVIERLQGLERTEGYVLGISIARSNTPEAASLSGGVEDYATSLSKLVAADLGDFYTLNISCPNVHGGESFAGPRPLTALLERLASIEHTRPVYLKMPINPPWDEFAALLEAAAPHRVHGVVIGNLNKDYARIPVPAERPPEYRGGISGPVCRELSLDLVHRTRQTFGNRFTILGCGGIETPEHALAYLSAGADLVQLITGMIFEGPHLMRDIAAAVASESGSGQTDLK